MDLKPLLDRNRRILKRQEEVASNEERRAFRQFAREYADGTQRKLTEAGETEAESKIPN